MSRGEAMEPRAIGATPVVQLVSDTIAWITPDASLLEVASALASGDVGALVVGDGETVIGIVSERDIVHALAAGRDPASTHASEVASTVVLWCDATATITEAAMQMMDQYVRHLLVEDDGRLVGVVSARDLLGVYAADAVADE
jgi:CBS domain-containing protein